ncbi:MAG: alpha/beta hydrolase [Clostridia bacterium]|nr:alpha/beta hydrolase [Clostridia bacterium]
MRKKPIILNAERNVSLIPYIASDAKKISFLICPGGGYNNCDESEGKPVAAYLNALGYHAFVLRYSVGRYKDWPHPLEDYEQAAEWLAAHAEEYALDPKRIVVIGFSAGGHVAAAAASLAIHKPFAAILCYALIDRETLDFCNPGAPDAADAVNADTCPCFIASSRNDWIVPITNTTKLIHAFQQFDIDYEAHIYGYAMHGFSIGKRVHGDNPVFCSRVGNWVEDSLAWLKELEEGRYISIRKNAGYADTHAETLSVYTSCRLLEQQPEAVQTLKTKHPVEYLMYIGARKKIGAFMDTVSLFNLFTLAGVKQKTIEKIDRCLRQFSLTDAKRKPE